jgi:hypothetical protein
VLPEASNITSHEQRRMAVYEADKVHSKNEENLSKIFPACHDSVLQLSKNKTTTTKKQAHHSTISPPIQLETK